MALVGFGNDDEKSLIRATSPFAFSTIRERSILRFLKLISVDNSKIGQYAKLVDDRNESAHPNGNIYFSEQAALDVKIREVMRVVQEIQNHSRAIIEECYLRFLRENYDQENREYPNDDDQIREMLAHRNYLSIRDIQACAATDLTPLGDEEQGAEMEGLHIWFCTQYADVLEEDAVA
jgi:hypothetical protein